MMAYEPSELAPNNAALKQIHDAATPLLNQIEIVTFWALKPLPYLGVCISQFHKLTSRIL